MSAMLHVIGRVITAFALLIGAGSGALVVADPARAARSGAYQATVTRTGGFAGVNEQYTVLSSTVHIYTADLMTTVSGREFRRLSASYPPAGTGADRFVYTVTVTYRNGVTKTVTTEDGTDAPAILWQVIDTIMLIDRDLAGGSAG